MVFLGSLGEPSSVTSTSESLPHLALLLITTSETGLLNFANPLFVLAAAVLQASALQELLLLVRLALLEDLLL